MMQGYTIMQKMMQGYTIMQKMMQGLHDHIGLHIVYTDCVFMYI